MRPATKHLVRPQAQEDSKQFNREKADLQRRANAAEARVLELDQSARKRNQEKEALQRRAAAAEAKVLALERAARERDAVVRHAEARIAELEGRARDLQQQVDAGHAAKEMALQLQRAQPDAHIPDVRSVAQALSGGVCTASHAELAAATRNFAAGSILGRGGFGPVYRGNWGGQAVAIKRLDPASLQGVREAVWEVTILGSYRHPHVVPLLCFSLSRHCGQQEACLVYPLMTRGGLDEALAARAACPLKAAARLRIAADVAAGLAFLHAPGAGLAPMLHRDVKSSNVLLDEGLRARVADVGLARPQRGGTMTAGVGTFGYIDPAYCATGERYCSTADSTASCTSE